MAAFNINFFILFVLKVVETIGFSSLFTLWYLATTRTHNHNFLTYLQFYCVSSFHGCPLVLNFVAYVGFLCQLCLFPIRNLYVVIIFSLFFSSKVVRVNVAS